MKPRLLAACAAILIGASGAGAQAAMIVHDPTSYAKILAQARTAIDQLNELKAQVRQAQDLFDSLNEASAVNAIAQALGLPELRNAVPQAIALSRSISELGEVGERAGAIREAQRLFTPRAGDPIGEAIEADGMRAARDLALAEALSAAGAARLDGLEELRAAIEDAPNARAVLDLQARLAAEESLIANDQMRVDALVMAQAAEVRLSAQRERERAAAARAQRIAMFRAGFE